MPNFCVILYSKYMWVSTVQCSVNTVNIKHQFCVKGLIFCQHKGPNRDAIIHKSCSNTFYLAAFTQLDLFWQSIPVYSLSTQGRRTEIEESWIYLNWQRLHTFKILVECIPPAQVSTNAASSFSPCPHVCGKYLPRIVSHFCMVSILVIQAGERAGGLWI